jgi:two-component system sensor histidine kinase MtrB
VTTAAAPRRFPSGFRRRLALTFVAVAGVASGALAIGAAAAVTSYRHHSFSEHARAEAAQDLRLVGDGVPAASLLDRLQPSEHPGGADVLVVHDGTERASVDRLHLTDVPASMRRAVRDDPGEDVSGTTRIAGDPFLVVGRSLDGAEVYFFFSRADLLRGLDELRVTLLIGWVVVLAAAGVVGTLVARRTLRPVQDAADAARSVAEGLLETRLSVDSDDEFGQWAASFNEMVAALADKVVALEAARDREERFNADVAHELRTPLGSIVTAATLLEQHADELPEHLRRPLALTVAGARRLHRLVDELLELHRLEAGQEQLDGSEVEPTDAVRATIAAHGWDRAQLHAEGGVGVVTDRRRLDRIVTNLVANAFDHGGGDVHIDVRLEPPWAVVVVRDDGPGISPEDLPLVFDRYFKVNRARTNRATQNRSGGSGLGLSIAAEQARLLGGDLSATSTVGRGSTFTLRLPAEP